MLVWLLLIRFVMQPPRPRWRTRVCFTRTTALARIASREFFYHLHDTLVLLGADAKLAELLDNPAAVGASTWTTCRYNGQLMDATKDKLVNVHKLAVTIAGRDRG